MVNYKGKFLYFLGIESENLIEEDRKELEKFNRKSLKFVAMFLVFIGFYLGGNFVILSKYIEDNKKFLAITQEEKTVLERVLLDENSSLEDKELVLTALDFEEYINSVIGASKSKSLNEYLGTLRRKNIFGNIKDNYKASKDMENEVTVFLELVNKNR